MTRLTIQDNEAALIFRPNGTAEGVIPLDYQGRNDQWHMTMAKVLLWASAHPQTILAMMTAYEAAHPDSPRPGRFVH